MAADKGMTMQEDGKNYGDFLLSTIESAKDQFTEDELKLLKEGAEKIRDIENKLTVIGGKVPRSGTGIHGRRYERARRQRHDHAAR